MTVKLPDSVLKLPRGALAATLIDPHVVLFLREEEWGLKKYPAHCPVEVRLGTWELEPVILVALLLRLARSDATTFETWINIGEPLGVRTLQHLERQATIDVHVVTDRIARSLRAAGTFRASASDLVRTIRAREAWTQAQFANAQKQLTKRYPTASALWWR